MRRPLIMSPIPSRMARACARVGRNGSSERNSPLQSRLSGKPLVSPFFRRSSERPSERTSSSSKISRPRARSAAFMLAGKWMFSSAQRRPQSEYRSSSSGGSGSRTVSGSSPSASRTAEAMTRLLRPCVCG